MRSSTAVKVPVPGPARLKRSAGPDEWLEAAKECKYLSEYHMKQLCEIVKEFMMEESNIQPVSTPVTICGDIHGQFYDLLELFRVAGGMPGETAPEKPITPANVISSADIEPPSSITNPKLQRKMRSGSSRSSDPTTPLEEISDASQDNSTVPSDMDSEEDADETKVLDRKQNPNFVFLGDYVDRGYFSLETLTLLLCLKAKFPEKITLVRGNHESRQITQVYGFYEECVQKYGNTSVWKACCQVFDFMTLGAIVDGKVLCVHGGLSPEIRTLDQVRVVARAQEIPHEGAFCDLVWSDPEDVETWAVSPRGAGWLFGDRVSQEFCHVNGLSLIARAHQLVNEGYKYHFKSQDVVTVWSAPNYCYRCGNMASVCEVGEDMKPSFKLFSAVKDELRHVPPSRGGRTTSVESPQNLPSTYQHGNSTTEHQASDGSEQSGLSRESWSASELVDNASVTSSVTSRGRTTGSRRMSNRDSSSRGSPGSHIDAYEKANAIPRRPSDGMIFQVVPSSGRTTSDASLMDLPNEVLTHVLSHLPPESLSLMSLVNSRFHRLVTTPPAWRIAFTRFFPGSESTGLVAPTPIDDDVQKSQRRAFTRVSTLASWRSEYILRTRLLRSLTRGRPAIHASSAQTQSRQKASSTAITMYNSGVMYPVSHIHANFGIGLNKKQPLFVHGAVEQGIVTSSDPAAGKNTGWGLADFEAFKHFADMYAGEAPYGLGAGDLVGMTNVMDISQSFGKLYGEACPGGRLFYTATTEQRGRFLMISSRPNHSTGIPEVNMTQAAITSVWLAKSENVLKVTNGLFGALAGSSNGILSAYAVGPSSLYDRRFEKGELTARWALCPGVPIVAICVDDKVSFRRISRGRIWAVVLNALGEVFYLHASPTRPESRGKLSEAELDSLAWQTGRSTEWFMLESTHRVAKSDPFQVSVIDGSYSPRSSSDTQGLNSAQLQAEAREIEQFMRHKPKHFQAVCEGWDMQRSLLVDYGGDNHYNGGESVFVVARGGDESSTASIKRFTRHRTKMNVNYDLEAYPAIAPPTRTSIFGSLGQRSTTASSPAGHSVPRSRTSSTEDLGDALYQNTWHMSNYSFGPHRNLQISALATDNSDIALLSASEDPLLGMSGGSASSSPLASPLGHANIAATASEIPGHRARLFAVGTTSGLVVLLDMRASSSPAPDIVNTIQPVRFIYTRSPQISSLAMTSLYVVHGGNDGLVQAWDPLASSNEPVRTLNSRFSDRARRRIAQAEASVQGVGNNYWAAGAIVLDPDPTILRGMVSLGTHLRYWSYSAGAADVYKSKKRGQLRRRSDRGSNATPNDQKYHHTGRGVLREYITDEQFELQREKTTKQKETDRFVTRFGTNLLGENASEEELLAYATMLSEEAYSGDVEKRLTHPPKMTKKTAVEDDHSVDTDLAEAIRLSLLETDAAAEVTGDLEFNNIPIRVAKSSRHGTPSKKAQTSQGSGSSSMVPTDDDDLQFALQLSLAEQESRKLVDENEFPTLTKSSSGESTGGKGKTRRR